MSKSKAETWAEELSAAKALVDAATKKGDGLKFRQGESIKSFVDSDGDLRITTSIIRRELALEYGRWIVEMYSPQHDAAPEPEPVGPFYVWCTDSGRFVSGPTTSLKGAKEWEGPCGHGTEDYITLAPPDPKWTKDNPPPRYVPKA